MGYESNCEFTLAFKEESDAEVFIAEMDKLGMWNPLSDNLEVTGWFGGDSEIFEVTLKETIVKMGEYKRWIPEVVKAEGIEYGSMDIWGEEPGDIWKVIFKQDWFEVQTGSIEYKCVDWDKFI